MVYGILSESDDAHFFVLLLRSVLQLQGDSM